MEISTSSVNPAVNYVRAHLPHRMTPDVTWLAKPQIIKPGKDHSLPDQIVAYYNTALLFRQYSGEEHESIRVDFTNREYTIGKKSHRRVLKFDEAVAVNALKKLGSNKQ